MLLLVAVLPHPPIFTEPLYNKTAYVGDTVTFRCVVLSDLMPLVRWGKHYQVNGSTKDVNGSWYIKPIPPVGHFSLMTGHKPSGHNSPVARRPYTNKIPFGRRRGFLQSF